MRLSCSRAHPIHEFSQRCARLSGERVARVREVVQVQTRDPSRDPRLVPDEVEVVALRPRAFRANEHPRVILWPDERIQMTLNLCTQESRQLDQSFPGCRLRVVQDIAPLSGWTACRSTSPRMSSDRCPNAEARSSRRTSDFRTQRAGPRADIAAESCSAASALGVETDCAPRPARTEQRPPAHPPAPGPEQSGPASSLPAISWRTLGEGSSTSAT